MPDPKTDVEQKLQKLGQRVRDGFAKENPTPSKQLEPVRKIIREQWEKERKTKTRQPSDSGPTKDRERQREDPEPGL